MERTGREPRAAGLNAVNSPASAHTMKPLRDGAPAMEVAAGREGLQNGLEERFIRLLADGRHKPAFFRPFLAMVTFVAAVLWFARPKTNDENLTSWRGLTEIASRQNK